MWCSKISSKREVCNNTILLEEIRSISNKQPKFTPKANRATMTTTKLVEGNHKIRAEINEKKMMRTTAKINKILKAWSLRR